MYWIPVAFKGKTVYAQAGPDGALLSEGGRTPIRYSKTAGAKVYRAGTTGLGKPKGKVVELDAGTAAEPSTGGSGGARKKKGSGFGKAQNGDFCFDKLVDQQRHAMVTEFVMP